MRGRYFNILIVHTVSPSNAPLRLYNNTTLYGVYL